MPEETCNRCGAELTDNNRSPGRHICKTCRNAAKRDSEKANPAPIHRPLTTDSVIANERKKKQFITALLDNGGFVQQAVHTAKTSREFVNNQYNADPEFALLWETVMELANEAIEQEIWRRAVTGVDKPLSNKGVLTGDTIKEWSDNLLMFLAKARMPAKYRDAPARGGELSEDEINARLAQYLEKRVGRGRAVQMPPQQLTEGVVQ
jgi:hypothetical protein